MKKTFSIFFILFAVVSSGHIRSPIQPDIYNRANFHLRKGKDFFNKGEFKEAIKEFDLAYRFSFGNKQKSNVIKKKVTTLMKIGNYEDALKTIEKWELGGEGENEFLFLKAECLQKLGKTVQAIKIFNILISQEKNERNKIFFETRNGLLFLSLDSLNRAEERFLNSLKILHSRKDEIAKIKKGQLKLIMYSLGYIYLKNRNLDKAKKYFQFLLENFKSEEIGYKSALYLGLIWHMKGEDNEAVNILNSIDIQKGSEVSALKGYLNYRKGLFKQAKEAFQEVEDDTLLSREIRKIITILSGECCYLLKDYSDAIIYYKRYIEMVNTSHQKMVALYGLAWSYFKSGKYSDAFAVLKDFSVLYPESPYVSTIERLSALSLFYVGEHRGAKFHFTKLLNLGVPLKALDRIYYLRGKSEFYLKEFEQAKLDFNKVVTFSPPSRWKPHALNMIARIDFEKQEYLTAYNVYKKLLKMELPVSLLDEVRLQTERCLLYLGYYKNPIEMSMAFVRKYPHSSKSTELQLEIAEFYFQLQKYWEAIREYERFLNLFPNNENSRFVLYKLARSYSQIGYYEKSLSIYQKLQEGNDQYAESAIVSMGDILFSQERYKESINVFKELPKRFPESNMVDYANFIIGKNYFSLNMPREARVSLELVVESKRIFPLKEKAKLMIAKTFYLEGKGEKYLAYLDRMIKTENGKLKAESCFLKAEYKKEMGRFKEAMDLYEQSSIIYEEGSDKVRALYEAGLSAEELMMFDKAMDFYKRALTISPVETAKFRIEERIKRIESMKEKDSEKSN